MVTEIRIYFEGDWKLRAGFLKFLREIRDLARRRRCRIELVATGGTPIEDYRTALVKHRQARNILLKDSEGPDDGRLFEDLCRREKLDRKLKNSVFWMVQVMEAWFLADVDAVAGYYGDGFRKAALRGNPNIEGIPKRDVLSKLDAATQRTKKRAYHKTKHAPDLLCRIQPERVCVACPNCRRIFDALRAVLDSK